MNFWSGSEQQALYDAAIQLTVEVLNVVQQWTPKQKRGAALFLIKTVLNALSSTAGSSNQRMWKEVLRVHVWNTRYRPLVDQGALDDSLSNVCWGNVIDVGEADDQEAARKYVENEDEDRDGLSEEARRAFEEFDALATKVKDLLLPVPFGPRMILAGNFVESLALWSTQTDGTEVASFLKCMV